MSDDKLLPTPVGTDALGARNKTSTRPEESKHHDGETLTEQRDADPRGGFANLRERVNDLLPTPTTDDAGDFQSLTRSIRSRGELTNPPSEGGNE